MTHEKIKAALEDFNEQNQQVKFLGGNSQKACIICKPETYDVIRALLEAQTSAASQQTRGEVPADNGGENCPDGMSCSGNGMDCVGDGFCKGPEVSHVNDINVADIPQAIENIGPNTTPEVSGEVDSLANFIRTIDGSNTMGAGDLAEKVSGFYASRNLLKSEGVCVPGEIIERACRSIQSMLLDLENQAEIDYPEETRRYVSQQRKYDNALSSLQEYRDTLEALRPFLPAEKE